MTLDRVGRDEIEDQAVLALAVAVDAAHPLLEAVGVPRNVVIEQDVADLKVDPFARGLGGHEDLDLAFAELLLGVEAGARLVTRTDFIPPWMKPTRNPHDLRRSTR